MHLSPDDERAIRAEFDRLANLTQADLRRWLETSESRKAAAIEAELLYKKAAGQ